MPTFRGKKRAGDHSSLISEAVNIVKFAQSIEGVSKISPGIIRVGGNRTKMSIKIAKLSGCLLVTVHGTSAVQELRLYANNLDALRALLLNKWGEI